MLQKLNREMMEEQEQMDIKMQEKEEVMERLVLTVKRYRHLCKYTQRVREADEWDL